MAINEKVSITLGDDKMFGIGVINGVITEESFKEGKRSISVRSISPIKKPVNYPDPFKTDIELSRYKQDCRKRALEAGFDEVIKKGGEVFQSKNVIEAADKYYNWLISIPDK